MASDGERSAGRNAHMRRAQPGLQAPGGGDVTWRCPHCRTVQADSSKCFLCGRSATSCGTCVNFRQSVVGGLGFCGLDKRREPLSGEERRGCWTGAVTGPQDGVFAALIETTESGLIDVRPPRGEVRPVTGR